ncbi:MAG: hypothetical protein HGB26_00495 [Desulfobulbaceae bacterium]|nr:hypothetical protein [Desulfobulbaceae bacterium]
MIEIPDISKDGEIAVAIIQLESPFDNEFVKAKDPYNKQGSILLWKDPQKRIDKVIKITNMTIDKYKQVKLLIFPEYSVPCDSWSELSNISNTHNIVIIGGSDYITSKHQNICPIFIPNNNTIFLVKEKPSIFESDLLFSNQISDANHHIGNLILKFTNNGKTYTIQTFICSDLLRGINDLDQINTGLIICTMCSPHTSSFYGLSEYLIRLDSPKFVLLSNATTNSSSMKSNGGRSGVCCSGDNNTTIKNTLDNSEGVIYTKLNLKNPRITNPTAIGSLLPISNTDISVLTKDGDDLVLQSDACSLNSERAVINPDLFRALGKKFRIFYLRCRNYAETLSELQKTSTYSASVLGNVDVIVKNINDASRRAMEYDLRQVANHFNDKSWNYFSVDKFLKYDGIIVSSGVNAIDMIPEDRDLFNLINLSKGIIGNINDDEIALYIKNKWIIGHTNDCEINENIRGLVNISLPDISPTGNIEERFENEVLIEYLDKQTVSGIYVGSSRGLQSVYVIEVCCNVCNLFSIVESLHAKSLKKSIRINTNSYLISKKLSQDLYSTLLVPTVPYDVSNIINTYIMKELGHDVCEAISLLPLDTQRFISKWYLRMNQQHGRVSGLFSEEQKTENKAKYKTILDIIKDTKFEFCKYLIHPSNIWKAGSSYNNLFGLLEACFQGIIEFVVNEYFSGDGALLLKSDKLSAKFKPNSPKSDINRLTFREKSNLIRGCLDVGIITCSIPFSEENFFQKNEVDIMVNYRNVFQHQKKEDIESIEIIVWSDLMLWMLTFINSEFVDFIKFPQLRLSSALLKNNG